MTVGELKDALDGINEDVIVKLAFQPDYPLNFFADEAHLFSGDSEDEFFISQGPSDNSAPYLPKGATELIGW
jgi:hypothetical protein